MEDDVNQSIAIQCPQCRTSLRLQKEFFAGRDKIRVRCTKCSTVFEVRAPVDPPIERSGRQAAHLAEATVASRAGGSLPAGKIVSLVVTAGPLRGKVFRLTKPRVVLGRSEADILIDDTQVSRAHCALEIHGAVAFLLDLGSSNGTFVRDEKIKSCELEHLSDFRIGANTLMFTVTDEDSRD